MVGIEEVKNTSRRRSLDDVCPPREQPLRNRPAYPVQRSDWSVLYYLM